MATDAETTIPRMTSPRYVDEALHDLAGGDAVAVAGATWLMRAPLRHERPAERFVALSRVEGFRRLEIGSEAVSIGPLATHDQLAHRLPDTGGLRGLRTAAARSANPGIRRIATIGGNLCAADFAASDFPPALLALDAMVEIADASGSRMLSVESFLAFRATRERPWLVTGIVVPQNGRLGAHQRLPMRRAGDYPCAIVSVSVELDAGGSIRDARVGVGAVEATARRWHNLERAVAGAPLSSMRAEEAARDLIADFTGRDAVDAPGWYRTNVLPVLVRRAFEAIGSDQAWRAP